MTEFPRPFYFIYACHVKIKPTSAFRKSLLLAGTIICLHKTSPVTSSGYAACCFQIFPSSFVGFILSAQHDVYTSLPIRADTDIHEV